MIPKVMNFFWGNKNLSWMRYMTLYSFKKLNPDWEVVLHLCPPNGIDYKTWEDEVCQDFFNFKGCDVFDLLNHLDIELKEWKLFHKTGESMQDWMGPSHKSNFFKWQQMAGEGGFYSDLDVLYVQPLDKYYEKVKSFDTVICHRHGYFSIGFLGSSGNNAFYRDVYDFCFRRFKLNEYQSAGVQTIYSLLRDLENISPPVPNSEIDFWFILVNKYSNLNFYNNSMSLVYPWKFNEMEEVFLRLHKKLPEDCIGIHWYAGAKVSQKFNNRMNEQNYKTFKNTYSYFARQVLLG